MNIDVTWFFAPGFLEGFIWRFLIYARLLVLLIHVQGTVRSIWPKKSCNIEENAIVVFPLIKLIKAVAKFIVPDCIGWQASTTSLCWSQLIPQFRNYECNSFLSPHPPVGYIALRTTITCFFVDFCFPNSPTVVKLNQNPSTVSEIEIGSNLFGHRNKICLIFANLYSKVVLFVVDYIHCFL
jgi:hypothetical protein